MFMKFLNEKNDQILGCSRNVFEILCWNFGVPEPQPDTYRG